MAADVTINLFEPKSGKVINEKVFDMGAMKFLYYNPLGVLLTELFVKRKLFSRLYGFNRNTASSKRKIMGFVKQYDINLDEVERDIEEFKTFNQFFVRKLRVGARPFSSAPRDLIAPADSRLMAYKIQGDQVFPVKGKEFTLKSLLGSQELAEKYTDGDLLIFRLAPVDYHRFHFIDSGVQGAVHPINGTLHSVSPLSLRKMIPVFTENYREYCLLNTQNFGEVLQIDVGALAVGKIIQKRPLGGRFERGQEKGWFEFGGSTVILAFQKGVIEMNPSIQEYSQKGIETLVKMGETIGAQK